MARTMADLGNRVWDDNEMQAFSIGENTRKYQDYKKQLEDDYDKNYSIGGNFLNWLGTGLSGGGWSKGDFLKNRGITDETDAYGNAGYFGNSSMGDLRNAGSEYNKGRTAQLEAGKGLFSGIPIVGDFISAPAQVLSAGKDLAEGGLSKWQNGKRDWLSDLGALGETAIDVATLGATSGAKTLGKTIGKGALLGAGYGLTGGLNEMGAKYFDLGRLATNTGIGAGIGGGIAGLGYGLGKAWNKYSPAAETKTETITTMGDATPYQEALNRLKDNATGARYSNVATNLPTTQGPDLARITLNNLDDDTLKTLYRSAARNTHPDKVGEVVGGRLFKSVNDSNTLLQDFLENGIPSTTTTSTTAIPIGNLQRLKTFASNIPNIGKDLANSKVGTKVSNLLKTKKGKIGLGIGGGLLLSQILGGRNQNQNNMTDEELYNYIVKGEQ